jgi:hypothetical protein
MRYRRRGRTGSDDTPPDRGRGLVAPQRGWPGRAGGHSTYLQPPPEWRGTTVQVCGLWPYGVGAGAPLIGAPLGKHLLSGATVCGDPISWFQHAGLLTAPTAFVLAREGFGKSSMVRRMATGAAYFGAIPLVLGDLKPDYPELITALDGEVIPLGRGRGYINPLDMSLTQEAVALLDSQPGTIDDQERAKVRRELLSDARGKRHAMVAALATIQRSRPLDDGEDTILAATLAELDERFEGEPVLRDLVQVIEAAPDRVRDAAYDQGSDERYRELTHPLIRTLRGLLQEGRIGEMFSRPTTHRLDLEHPAVFDVSSIPEDQTELVAAALTTCWGVGFSAVNTRVALAEAGILPMRHYLVILDELWRVLLAARSGMIDRVNSLTRLNRQVGAGLIMISHTIKDLLSLPEEHERMKALGLIERSGMLICGALPPEEHPRLRQVKDFTDAELRLLSSWQDPPPWGSAANVAPPGLGKFLIKVGGRPGIPLHVSLTAAEQRLGIHDTSRLWHTATSNGHAPLPASELEALR